MKLVSSNVCAYEKAIQEQPLPETFRDAISVTRKLGFRYLWIDALCIIQDSNEDWEREASKMASVYKNCPLMLSATDATNSHGGLFRDRNDNVLFKISDHVSRRCGFPEGTYAHSPRLGFESAVSKSALSQRGWTLQESVLAPVVVHFCYKQIFWECRQAQISEDGQFTGLRTGDFAAVSRVNRRLVSEPWLKPQAVQDEYTYCVMIEPIQLDKKEFRRIGICSTWKPMAQAFFADVEPTEIRIC